MSNNTLELKAYNVKSPSNIRTKGFGVSLPGPFLVDPPQEKIVSYLLSILSSEPGRERFGGRSNWYCEK